MVFSPSNSYPEFTILLLMAVGIVSILFGLSIAVSQSGTVNLVGITVIIVGIASIAYAIKLVPALRRGEV
jgi:hypothetical protein